MDFFIKQRERDFRVALLGWAFKCSPGCLLTLARLARELLTSQLVMTNELKCLLSLLETYNKPSELMSDELLVQP